MFYKSYEKSEARAFDHLYDPLYIAGNIRDIQKENNTALAKTAPINIFTNYESMFSDSPQRPRKFFVIQQNKLPKSPVLNSLYYIFVFVYLFSPYDIFFSYF